MTVIVKIPMVFNQNDTYTWLECIVAWAEENCPSLLAGQRKSLEHYIVRDPKDYHYKFTFENDLDAMLFALRWL